MAFTILQATLDHADIIAPLFDAYRQFYGKPSNLDRGRTFISKRIINRDSAIFLAVDAADAKRGLGFTQLYPSFSSVSMRRLWILNDLYVLDEARGQGIATALLQKAREFAEQTSAKGLVLETAIDNTEAQRLYEKLGWQRNEAFYNYHLTLIP
jgi:GNAT superfamily N-acetyltransferase